ncbi:MAG: hypothetical protein EB084_25330, partial [Proteobacteria bacterium]|nr:hypothetical protein [Pseudomonadota bacterium]
MHKVQTSSGTSFVPRCTGAMPSKPRGPGLAPGLAQPRGRARPALSVLSGFHSPSTRHAQTARHGKGAENKDYERIGSEFHRWVRDKKSELGLEGTDAFSRFVHRDLDFYARHALRIHHAGQKFTEGLESIYFNQQRSFTTQRQLLLAAIQPSDSAAEVERKLRLVADYLDIWLTRQTWNNKVT